VCTCSPCLVCAIGAVSAHRRCLSPAGSPPVPPSHTPNAGTHAAVLVRFCSPRLFRTLATSNVPHDASPRSPLECDCNAPLPLLSSVGGRLCMYTISSTKPSASTPLVTRVPCRASMPRPPIHHSSPLQDANCSVVLVAAPIVGKPPRGSSYARRSCCCPDTAPDPAPPDAQCRAACYARSRLPPPRACHPHACHPHELSLPTQHRAAAHATAPPAQPSTPAVLVPAVPPAPHHEARVMEAAP
jgi:hypothetical protein